MIDVVCKCSWAEEVMVLNKRSAGQKCYYFNNIKYRPELQVHDVFTLGYCIDICGFFSDFRSFKSLFFKH